MNLRFVLPAVAVLFCSNLALQAAWTVHRPHDGRESKPPTKLSDPKPIAVGDAWPNDEKFRWLRAGIIVPELIKTQAVSGACLGLRVSCGDGGEVWVDGQLASRFDNDHPALALLTTNAVPGNKVQVDVQVYGKVQGGDRFGEASLVLIERKRACEPLRVTVDAGQETGGVPNGLIGLSQGGGMADYEAATAAKLKEGGFKWFRMDNIFTQVLKKGTNDQFVYDWKDFDRRIDFLAAMGAEAIMAVSYMPQVLDAVPNNDRQSAPKSYAAWEDLCFKAAQRCVERGKPVAFWEVWNEVNTGWLKPGPEDTGTESFKKLYSEALGKEATDHEVVRRFEAYCKLYRATVLGVRRADPKARIGGPALASGPYENKERGHCFNGRGFARGLMLWCRQEKLPLDFVSWHEYFQEPHVFTAEAKEFRDALAAFPEFSNNNNPTLMITEWNQAWWGDRPQDHEVGAAWCADGITRSFIPERIAKPCFFYAKQGDMNFRGDYSLLLKDNTPKAVFNVLKIFNQLSGKWLKVLGTDGEVSAVAAFDPDKGRLALVLVNFTSRYNLSRPIKLSVSQLPTALRNGTWKEWLVDGTHCNAWHDSQKAELTQVRSGSTGEGRLELDRILAPNSVTLIEVVRP